jgi:hypothetical protein
VARNCRYVRNLNDLLALGNLPHCQLRVDADHGFAAQEIAVCGRRAVRRSNTEIVAIAQPKVAKLGPADPHRILQYGLEDRLKLPQRTADDPQNLRGAGLLLQSLSKLPSCLGEFAGPLVKLLLEIRRGTATARGAGAPWRLTLVVFWGRLFMFATTPAPTYMPT